MSIRDLAAREDGQQPMTPAQAARLKILSEAAFEPEAFRSRLTRVEAEVRIETLSAKLKLQDGPPHTF
jgi:Protein of unknown function (DUF3072)